VPGSARRAGFTLIELLACSVLLAVGLAVAVAGAKHYGWLGALIGFFVGFLGLLVILGLLITVAEALWLAGLRLPRCHSGRDYVRDGRRFMERLPDGTLSPYMVHRPLRGWSPDARADD
jgi:prepilin-type N-terminal cleavage/methylation domain-containing protein